MPVVYIRWAVSHPGAVGQSGMEDTVMTSASFLKGDGWDGRNRDHANHRITRSCTIRQHRGDQCIREFPVTCHDGFTLYDLYAYNTKHNEKNGWG